VSIELGAKYVNQLKAIPESNNRNNLILWTSVMPTSLICARNCPICSYVVLLSSPLNMAKFGIQNPRG
jgi:hypothetical protein